LLQKFFTIFFSSEFFCFGYNFVYSSLSFVLDKKILSEFFFLF